ncbi:type IV pilus biogenesis/stability protein PilW [Uliginosibacterium sp. sgz301328]|uniref:type IV pilus biogenesis/stability protein PilW n=1 Tax=Uliginosibacterium sp. sgz301328 TaxID=3243764 RepID=UPI00359EC26A
MRKLVIAGCAVLLSACATNNPVGPSTQSMARPESDQASTSDARSKAKIHVELGTAYLEGARFSVALDEARTALAYDNSYAPAHLLLASVFSYLEQYDQALPEFETASRLAPGDPEVNNSYGWFLCSRGRESEGLQRLLQAARNPYYNTPGKAYTNAGLCYVRMKDDASAEAQFTRAYQLDQGNRVALFQLASISYRAGKYEGAKQWLAILQRQMPASTPETLWLGLRIERKLGNRPAESTYAMQLRRDFATSDEYQAFMQGKYE